MVPYVRKSFYKHYLDGLNYVDRTDTVLFRVVNTEEATEISIDDRVIYDHDASYEYAMDMTKKELEQAVEGMYHNLNTLGRLNSNIKNIAA